MRLFLVLRHPLAALLLLAAAAVTAAPLPVEKFYQKAQYGGAAISPSGRYVAVLTPWRDRRNVAILDLETRKPNLASTLENADAISVIWLNDNRLIVTFGDLQRGTGEPPRQSGVVAVDRDGSNVRQLPSSFSRPRTMGILRGISGTDDVLVTSRDRSATSVDVYRLNTRTGTKELLTHETPGDVNSWVLDFDNVPRAAVTSNLEKDTTAWYVRDAKDSPWKLVAQGKGDSIGFTPVAFAPDGKMIYVRSRERGDRYTLHEYDIASGKLSDAIIQHPERDIVGTFRLDLKDRKVLGFGYQDDRPSVAWFDKEFAGVQKAVDAALPDTVNNISRARDGGRWIVTSGSDRDPGTLYLLDGKTFKLEKLFDFAPWFKPEEMAETRYVRYKARDGMVIPALLTIPKGMAGKKVPLIVDIHGGPNVGAASWGFELDHQFFASRGYATLAPQFRGTNGFGKKLFTSGFRKWGDEMQYDLVDGVQWAIEQGIADKDRVCYYGASYGGYAAMWGAIQDKELIKCAVAFVGVSSIDFLFDNAQTDVAASAEYSSTFRERVGDPKTERDRFKRVSPVNHADKVGVPILLAYGADDLRVPIVHGTAFKSALDKHGKPYEWVVYNGEGHGWNKSENVFDFYNRVEKFLAKHLGQ